MHSSLLYHCSVSQLREFEIPSCTELLKELITIEEVKEYLNSCASHALSEELLQFKVCLNQLETRDLEKTISTSCLEDINECYTEELKEEKNSEKKSSFIKLVIQENALEKIKTILSNDKSLRLKSVSDFSIQLFFAKYDIRPPRDLPESIMHSPAYLALKLNFYEAVKNSFDAGATKLFLYFYCDKHQVEVVITDNQTNKGFREGSLSEHFINQSIIDYRTILSNKSSVSSSKVKRLSLGGAGKGLMMIDNVLQKHKGKLVLETSEEHSAILRLISPVSSPSLNKIHPLTTNTPEERSRKSSFAALTPSPLMGAPVSPKRLSTSPLFTPSSSSCSSDASSSSSANLFSLTDLEEESPLHANNLTPSPKSGSPNSTNNFLTMFGRRLTIDVVEEESSNFQSPANTGSRPTQ